MNDQDPNAQAQNPNAASAGHAGAVFSNSAGAGMLASFPGGFGLGGGGGGGSDSLASLVEGVQRHVQLLNGLKAELDAQSAEMASRHAQLNDRFVELAQRESALRERQEQTDATSAALEARKRELDDTARWLDQREGEVRSKAEQSEAREREAGERARCAEARAAEMGEQRRHAEERAGEAQRGFEEAQRRIEESQRLLEEARGQAEQATARAGELDRSQADAAARASEAERQLAETGASAADAVRALGEANARASELEKLFAAARGELESQRAGLEAGDRRCAELDAQLGQARGELDAARARIAALEQGEAALAAKEAELAEMRSRLEAAEAAGAALRVELQQREQDLAERSARLTLAEKQAEEQSARLRELESRPPPPAPEPVRIDDPRVPELAAKLRAAEEELEAARDDVARLSMLAERARAGAAASGQPDPRVAETAALLQSARAECETLRESLSRLEPELATARAEIEALKSAVQPSGPSPTEFEQAQRELDQAMRVIEALQGEREKLATALKNAKAEAQAAHDLAHDSRRKFEASAPSLVPAPAGADGGPAEGRRERLSRYRAALRAQRAKINQVQSLLTERLAEVQDVNTRKAALAAELQHLEQTRQKIEHERAALLKERQQTSAANEAPVKGKRGAPAAGAEQPARAHAAQERSNAEPSGKSKGTGGRGVFVLGFAAALAIAGGIAWQVAGAFKKPTAVATMTLGIDERQEETTKEQQESWGAYIAELPKDERLLERAAERMGMRGFADLSTSTGLDTALRAGLDVDATTPGKLKLSLTYPGFDRAALALDTLATTMIGFANENAMVRADKASTVIATGAASANEPVEDPRLSLFAAIYGGLTALLLFASAVIYRRAQSPDEPSPRRARRAEVVPAAVTVTPMVASIDAAPEPGLPQAPLPGGKNMLKSIGE